MSKLLSSLFSRERLKTIACFAPCSALDDHLTRNGAHGLIVVSITRAKPKTFSANLGLVLHRPHNVEYNFIFAWRMRPLGNA